MLSLCSASLSFSASSAPLLQPRVAPAAVQMGVADMCAPHGTRTPPQPPSSARISAGETPLGALLPGCPYYGACIH